MFNSNKYPNVDLSYKMNGLLSNKLNGYTICVLITFAGVFITDTTKASHEVATEYTRSGYVPLENSNLLDVAGYAITCILKSPSRINTKFDWKWRNPHSNEPGHYFSWSNSLSDRNGDTEYTSTLAWNNNVTETIKQAASGVIYAEGAHVDDPTDRQACADVTLSIIWKPSKPSVIHSDSLIIGENGQIECNTEDPGYPNSTVVWIKEGHNYTGPGSTYSIINLNITKADDGSSWKCYFYNLAGNSEMSDVKTLNVSWAPGRPNVTSARNNSNLQIGEKVKLSCILDDKGKPEGQLIWTKDGVVHENYTDETISFDIIKGHADTSWGCHYRNSVGKGPESNTIKLMFWKPGKAEVKLSPEASAFKLGQKVHLTCESPNKGNPRGQVEWVKDGVNQTGQGYDTGTIDFQVTDEYNGTEWSCYYSNLIGKGANSDVLALIVIYTPQPPQNVTVVATSASLSSYVDIGAISASLLETYTGMNITWLSEDDESYNDTVLLPANTTQYLLSELNENTNYTIQVSYINDLGNGEPTVVFGKTKEFPIAEDPIISRHWLSAVAKMDIANPNSVARVELLVCGSMNDMNCANKSTTDITEGEFVIEAKDHSFSGRYIKLVLYDEGQLISMYSDNIDAPVAAIAVIALGCILIIGLIIVISVIIVKKQGKGTKTPPKEVVEDEINPYTYSNPTMVARSQSRTGTGPASDKVQTVPPVYSVVTKGKPLAPIAASQADGDVYSQVDWSKKTKRPSLKGSPMSKKAIDKIMFSKNDGYINMQFEVSKKFAGDIDISVCLDGDQSCTSKVSKEHVRGTKNVVMVLPIEETSQEKYAINMKFIMKGQMIQEVDLTYPYEQNAVHVTVMNDAYVTSGTDVKASEMPEYSEVNKSKKTKGSEMPIYSEVNKPKKKKKAAEEQPYEDVETKNQSSHNERSTNAVSPSNAEVAVEGVPPHPPRKGAPKEGVMYAELDLNSSGAPRLLPRLGSKSPAQEPVIYADVRPGQKDVV